MTAPFHRGSTVDAAAPRVPGWLGSAWLQVAVKTPAKDVDVWDWSISPAQRAEMVAAREAGLVITMQRKEPAGAYTLLAVQCRRGYRQDQFRMASRADEPPREAVAGQPPAGAGDVQTPAPVVPPAPSRNQARWSDARRDIYSRLYLADVPMKVILQQLHASPGDPLTLNQVYSYAGFLGIHRPAANADKRMPVSRATISIYAEAMGVVFDGKSLADVNATRRETKRPLFFVPREIW